MSIMAPTDEQVQEEFDQFVINSLNIVHNKKTTPKILKSLKSNPDTVDAVADMAVILTNRLLGAKKKPISGAAFIQGINVMVGELITLAESAGANPLNEEQRYQAYSSAISQVLNEAVSSKKMKPQDLERIKAKLDHEGRMEAQKAGVSMPQEQPMPQEQQPQQPMPQQQPQSQQPQASQRQPMPQQKPGILGGR